MLCIYKYLLSIYSLLLLILDLSNGEISGAASHSQVRSVIDGKYVVAIVTGMACQ